MVSPSPLTCAVARILEKMGQKCKVANVQKFLTGSYAHILDHAGLVMIHLTLCECARSKVQYFSTHFTPTGSALTPMSILFSSYFDYLNTTCVFHVVAPCAVTTGAPQSEDLLYQAKCRCDAAVLIYSYRVVVGNVKLTSNTRNAVVLSLNSELDPACACSPRVQIMSMHEQ